jgi:hypothetical protein
MADMTAIQKTALVTSFVLTSAVGCAFVYLYWSAEGAAAIGIGRAVAFVAIMACVHAIGYLLYQQQSQAATSPEFDLSVQVSMPTFAESYREAIKVAVLQQIIFLVLSALLLDGGQTFRVCCITAIVHWVCIAMILVRRPVHPTRLDILLIKYGFPSLAFVVGGMQGDCAIIGNLA